MHALNLDLQFSFASRTTPPAAQFVAPLSGRIADIATLLYDPKADTITLNLVKIDKLPEGATPDDVCNQAMAALRRFADVDPTTGQLEAGMAASELTAYFNPEGSPIQNASSEERAPLDQAFRLRYSFATEARHFECLAPLFGTTHTLNKLTY
jgi:hypothetical protein